MACFFVVAGCRSDEAHIYYIGCFMKAPELVVCHVLQLLFEVPFEVIWQSQTSPVQSNL